MSSLPLSLVSSPSRKEQTIAELEASKKILAEDYLDHFLRQAWHIIEPKTPLIWGWHLDAICEHLQAVTNFEIKNLIINIPPRHTKSITTAVMWPAWEWIKNPETRWLFSSYAEKLSIRDSRKCRNVIQSRWYQERWGDRYKITSDQNQKVRFDNNKQGTRIATSVGGVGTGEGGDHIVCLPYDAMIITPTGQMQIGDIVTKKMQVDVVSFNHNENKMESQPILDWMENENEQELVEIEFEDGRKVVCTNDHPIFVEGKGYVPAYELIETDKCMVIE